MTTESLKNILYAEDEEDIREITKIALGDIGGFNLELCTNGKEVLTALNHYKPDLILLDVMMPIMDGPMTLKEIRKLPEFESIPVVFMTARIQANEIAGYKSLGVIDVIIKPFDPVILAESLQKIWKDHRKTV